MLKGGIIGLGKMGISHAAIVGAHPSVDMVAVCDTSDVVGAGATGENTAMLKELLEKEAKPKPRNPIGFKKYE